MQLDREARRLLQGLLDDRNVAELIHYAAKDNSEESIKLGVPARFPSTFQLVVGSSDPRDRDPERAMILELTADLVLPMLVKYLEANAKALEMAGVTLPPAEPEFEIPEPSFGGLMPGAIAEHIKDALDKGLTGMAFRLGADGKLQPVPEDELPAEVRERFTIDPQKPHQGGWPTASTFMGGLAKKSDPEA